MCAGCGFPSAPGHWTDAGAAAAPGAKVRLRLIRRIALNRMLKPFNLTVYDDGITAGLQISTAAGASEIVANLEALWPTAERLAKCSIDPLAPYMASS